MSYRPVPIGKLCLPTSVRDPSEAPDQAFRYVDISGIDRTAKTIASSPEIVGSEAPSRARKEIRADDVIVSTVRPNLNAVAVVPPELDGQIASTGFCVLRPNKDVVVGKYLFYFTQTGDFIRTLVDRVRGAHYPAVSDDDVKSVEIPYCARSEQLRIVEILDQADALRKKRAEADAKAARILPALFYKMFGDPATLMLSSQALKLGDMDLDIRTGFACGEKSVEGGAPHLRMNNIDDDGVLNLDLVRTVPNEFDTAATRLGDGDVLFMATNSEDKIGKTCVFHNPDSRHWLFSNHLVRIRVSDRRVTPEFIAAFLHLLWSKRFYISIAKRWVNQASISVDTLSSIPVPVPGSRRLGAFSSAFKARLACKGQRSESRQETDKLFSLLLHRAFSAELTKKWRQEHIAEQVVETRDQMTLLIKEADDA